MEERSLSELSALVGTWAKEKGIWGEGDFLPQFLKFREEVMELSSELVAFGPMEVPGPPDRLIKTIYGYRPKDDIDQDAMEKELGDVLVTLIILASKTNTSVEKCLGKAYDKISKRTGRTIDGVFVKSEDLPENN